MVEANLRFDALRTSGVSGVFRKPRRRVPYDKARLPNVTILDRRGIG